MQDAIKTQRCNWRYSYNSQNILITIFELLTKRSISLSGKIVQCFTAKKSKKIRQRIFNILSNIGAARNLVRDGLSLKTKFRKSQRLLTYLLEK